MKSRLVTNFCYSIGSYLMSDRDPILSRNLKHKFMLGWALRSAISYPNCKGKNSSLLSFLSHLTIVNRSKCLNIGLSLFNADFSVRCRHLRLKNLFLSFSRSFRSQELLLQADQQAGVLEEAQKARNVNSFETRRAAIDQKSRRQQNKSNSNVAFNRS